MIQGREDVQWNETEIFKHLARKFRVGFFTLSLGMCLCANDEKDEYERLLALQQRTDDDSSAKADTRADLDPVDNHDLSRTQADTLFEIISELKEAGALAKRQLTLDLVASTLRRRYEIDTDDHARDIIDASAVSVLEKMEQSDFDWSRKALYRDLKQASEKEDIRQMAITPLRPRVASDDDESEHESDDEDHPRARRRRVRKSVLRPKLASVSTKKAGKKTRSAARDMEISDDNDDDDDEESDMGESLETPTKSRGLDLVRDPPPSTAPSTINGRAHSILSEADSLAIRKTPLQETHQSGNLAGPDFTSLPEDTWTCSVQGCGKIIHKASLKRSKELIHDHTLTHAADTQSKLDLVFAEHRLNINMGVDNLLSRIREFGGVDGEALEEEIAAKRIRR
jgi:hypothetical protein